MMTPRKLLLASAILVGSLAPLSAQQFNAANGPVPGHVAMCLDSSSRAVACSTTNRLPVAATITPSGTQNVAGTGTAGTPAGGLLTIQGVASMTPILTTLSGTNNINNVSGTISLPTGAATAAKQPALGTAGTSSTDVVSVQGIANGTALPVSSAASASGGASYARIAPGQATTVVKASAGTLYAICLNSAATATNTTTVYDHASGSGTVIAVPAATTATVPTCLQYGPAGIAFANGLTFITATANGGDMTVAYK